jgi:hypothetical protein
MHDLPGIFESLSDVELYRDRDKLITKPFNHRCTQIHTDLPAPDLSVLIRVHLWL